MLVICIDALNEPLQLCMHLIGQGLIIMPYSSMSPILNHHPHYKYSYLVGLAESRFAT
jgi:hypothetical protein